MLRNFTTTRAAITRLRPLRILASTIIVWFGWSVVGYGSDDPREWIGAIVWALGLGLVVEWFREVRASFRISPPTAREQPQEAVTVSGSIATRRTFFPELEGLRGCAALAVFLAHVCQTQLSLSGIPDYSLSASIFGVVTQTAFCGIGAVGIFFVLSGYVLGANIDPVHALDAGTVRDFFIRRFLRLFPPLATATLSAALIAWVTTHHPPPFQEIERTATLAHEFTLNPPFWTLYVEWQFSLFYLALLWLVARLPIPISLAMMVALMYLGDSVASMPWLPPFYCGLLVPKIGPWLVKERKGRFWTIAVPILAIACYGLADLLAVYHVVTTYTQIWIISAGGIYFVSWVRYRHESKVTLLLKSRIFRYLGRISFSLYILHYPIVSAVAQKFAFFHHIHNISLRTILVLLIAGPPVFLLAHLSCRFVEQPSVHLAKRIVRWFREQSSSTPASTHEPQPMLDVLLYGNRQPPSFP